MQVLFYPECQNMAQKEISEDTQELTYCTAYQAQQSGKGVCLSKRDKTTRPSLTCQDSDIYFKIRIYTARLVFVHQDSYIYINICVYTSRFVSLNINQAFQMYRNIKIRVCTLRFVYIHQDQGMYIHLECLINI